MSKPEAPTPPDPKDTSQAATGTSVATALANTMMGQVGQTTPYGSVSYGQSGTYNFTDPYTGASYELPQFTATTTLSPEQQALYDQQTSNQTAMGAAAGGGIDNLQGMYANGPTQAPTYQAYGTEDYSADRNEYEAAMMARMQPSLDNSQEALDASLANQGIGYGAEAYNDAQFTQSQAENDANMAAILAAGEEQQRMFNMDMAATQGNNANASNQFSQQQGADSQYLNSIMAMMNGTQASVPQFGIAQPAPIPTTDNAGLINSNYQQQQQAYAQQQALYQSMMGGLFGLGSAGITAW